MPENFWNPHGEHAVLPSPGWKVFLWHSEHEVKPASAEKVPAEHKLHLI